MSTSISTLSFEQVHIEKKLTSLLTEVKRAKENVPSQNTRLLGKMKRWITQLTSILSLIDQVKDSLRPKLEKVLEVSLHKNELLLVAMFQPSTKNLFLEMMDEFPSKQEELEHLVALSEMAEALALVGDAAISLAALHHVWQLKAVDVGVLTQRRSDIVNNEHMAELCDNWGLYELRIHFDPHAVSKSEMEHDKGTLLEAIYGIVYIEHGLEKIKELVRYLV
jgi:ribonuclease-3